MDNDAKILKELVEIKKILKVIAQNGGSSRASKKRKAVSAEKSVSQTLTFGLDLHDLLGMEVTIDEPI